MMKRAVYLLLILSVLSSCGDADGSADKSSPEQWIPDGWKSIANISGDLNHDGKDDVVLVLEEDNSSNRIENNGLGAPILNTNPRQLMILFQADSGYAGRQRYSD